MSTPFYDLASLVVVPSGYKASKVYAQKPLTTDGQLTFSRASTATRVNSAGLIETVSSNVPRLDYLNSSCPKLLLEPSRTNKCPSSANYGTNIINTTVTRNTVSAPNGVVEADTLQDDNADNEHLLGQNFDSITNGSTYTVSCFFKANGSGGRAVIRYYVGNWTFAVYNLANGTVAYTDGVGTASIQNYGNGWYRCILTATASTDYDPFVTQIGVANSTNSYNYQGSSSLGVHFWGYQAETGAYATSLIPTTTAAVTRLADACSKTGISSLIGQTEGTLFVDLSEVNDLDFPEVTIDNNTNTDRIVLTRASNGNWGIFVASSAAATYSVYSTTSSASGKFALAYSSAGYVLYRNGVQIVTGTYNLPAALSAIRFNGRSTSDFYATKKVAQALLFKTRLTNAQLAELTAL